MHLFILEVFMGRTRSKHDIVMFYVCPSFAQPESGPKILSKPVNICKILTQTYFKSTHIIF